MKEKWLQDEFNLFRARDSISTFKDYIWNIECFLGLVRKIGLENFVILTYC